MLFNSATLRRLDVCTERETIIAIYRTKKAINLSILRDYSCTDDVLTGGGSCCTVYSVQQETSMLFITRIAIATYAVKKYVGD